MHDPETIVREFCAAWDRRDVEEILPGSARRPPSHTRRLEPGRGPAAIREVLNVFVPPASRIHFEVRAIVSRGDLVFTERVDHFTVAGKEVALPVAGVFELRDGKIAAWRDYFDMGSYQRQIG